MRPTKELADQLHAHHEELAMLAEAQRAEIAASMAEMALSRARLKETERNLQAVLQLLEAAQPKGAQIHQLPGAAGDTTESLAHLQRTKAVLVVLFDADGALHRSDILKELKRRGRSEDSMSNVSTTLGHLHRDRRVGSGGERGTWTIPSRSAVAKELGLSG